jgi:hypothetical protein
VAQSATDRPLDVSFVIDSMERLHGGADSRWAGRVDCRKAGVRGSAVCPYHRFVPPLIHFIPGSLIYSVPLFMKRQRDRALGWRQWRQLRRLHGDGRGGARSAHRGHRAASCRRGAAARPAPAQQAHALAGGGWDPSPSPSTDPSPYPGSRPIVTSLSPWDFLYGDPPGAGSVS